MPTLQQLGEQFITAKLSEQIAISERRKLGADIATLLPPGECQEGTARTTAGDYEIKVEYGITRSVDNGGAEEIRKIVSPEIFDALIRFKPTIATAPLRYLELNEPEIYARVAKHITSKPSAPQVSVELKT